MTLPQLPALPRTVTARALSVALDRAMPPRQGLRRDLAARHGLSEADVTRATQTARGDSMALRRVAACVGYEPVPHQPGHYRRRGGPDPMEA